MRVFDLFKVIINKITIVNSDSEANALICEMFIEGRPIVLSFANYFACMKSFQNNNMEDALINSDYLLRDGIGVEKLLLWGNVNPGINMNGTDLIPKILDHKLMLNRPIILLGTTEERLFLAKEKLISTGKMVVETIDGFQNEQVYINAIDKYKELSPVILLGMGMPKQELLSRIIKLKMPSTALIINGGAIIDRYSGSIAEAPSVIRKANLEWLFRFFREPKRLFSRIFIYGSKFIVFALLFKFFGSERKDERNTETF
ncbi:WecB/TagA/CpsF family glycosyltransferase [Aliivibrio fischeri]|uniref:WecB/TagA/CpsF family glycosyltransferase n=1 Tax=Aliivibrio fischeri TaxID=668 RepID=UPI0007C5567C|nr:WecB/TagA/CpsF family glycosyltransferase [Aliivibrio fischeri]